MIKRLSLTGALITQPDPEEVGGNNCTVLENAEFDKAGIVYKRIGRGDAISTGILMHQILRWYEGQTGAYYWVGSDVIGSSIKTSTNLTSWTTQLSSSSVAYLMHNFGNALRFSTGQFDKIPYILQYLDRKFFWTEEEITTGLYTYPARMTDKIEEIGHPAVSVTSNTWFKSYDLAGGTEATYFAGYLDLNDDDSDGIPANTYYYKYSIVFDGNQETEIFGRLGNTFDTATFSATAVAQINLTLDVGWNASAGSNLANWNNRITGINIYKSKNPDSSFAKMVAVSTLSDSIDITKGTRIAGSTYENRGVYVPNGLLTQLDSETGRKPEAGDWMSQRVTKSWGAYGEGVDVMGNTNGIAGVVGGTGVGEHSYTRVASDSDGVWCDDKYSFTVDSVVSDDVIKLKDTMHNGTVFEEGNFRDTSVSGGVASSPMCWGDDNWILRGDNISTDGSVADSGFIMTDYKIPADAGSNSQDWSYDDWTVGGPNDSNVTYAFDDVAGDDFSTKVTNSSGSQQSYRIEYISPKIDLSDASDKACILRIKSLQQDRGTVSPYLLVSFSSATSGWKKLFNWTYQSSTGGDDGDEFEMDYYIYTGHYTEMWLMWATHDPTGVGSSTTGAIDDGETIKIHHGAKTTVNKMCQVVKRTRMYYGTKVYVADDFDMGVDMYQGKTYVRGTGLDTDERGWVKSNVKKELWYQAQENVGPPTDIHTINVSKNNYLWLQNADKQQILTVFDTGILMAEYHPFGDTSTKVNYKHMKYLNGRNFVGDVQIEAGGETENHYNWVIFSELNQPDVFPITNYIQMIDNQGGKIKGLETLLDDLVVFMEHGIFRLSIPSADPKAWSLSEAEPNIGCIATSSITAVEGAVFFASKEHLYRIDPNFNVTPVTTPIKDIYQSLTTSETSTQYFPKKQQLYCRFGTSDTPYVLDLSRRDRLAWSKFITTEDHLDKYVIDENSDIWSYDSATYKIRKHDNSGDEATSFKRTTGWIPVSDFDNSGFLRRVNLRANSSSEDVVVKVYTDGDISTARKWRSGNTNWTGVFNGIKSLKPGIRCKQFMIEISCSANDQPFELQSLEVEYE